MANIATEAKRPTDVRSTARTERKNGLGIRSDFHDGTVVRLCEEEYTPCPSPGRDGIKLKLST